MKNSIVVSLVLSILEMGCGSDGGGSCGLLPCGGNVVGAWNASSACLDRSVLNQAFLASISNSCPSASIGSVALTPSGSATFGADLSYTATLSMTTSVGINFPASCLNGVTCAALTTSLQSTVGQSGITSLTCVGSGSCTCTMLQALDLIASSGTYATTGTTLALNATTGTSDGGEYCVKGQALHFLDVSMDMTMVTIDSDIVLTRR